MVEARLKGCDTGGTLDSTREKCGVGISGDRRIRARFWRGQHQRAARLHVWAGNFPKRRLLGVPSGWRLGRAWDGRLAEGKMD